MSVEIRDRVRSHFRSIDDQQLPVDWSEITEVAGSAEFARFVTVPGSTPLVRPVWLVATATAAVVVLLVGLIPLLVGGDDQPATDTVMPTTLTESTPTTFAEPTLISWSQVPHDESVFGGAEMRSVTAAGPGLVAVGSSSNGDGNDAAVWTSVDGVTWSRVPHDESVFGGGVSSLRGVTAGGPGLVAVGSTVHHGAQSSSMSAAVWTSVDGVTWSSVPFDSSVFGGTPLQVGGTEMSGVTAGGPGLVAVGWHRSDVPTPSAFVWVSSDGITWSQVPYDDTAFGGAKVSGVTAASPGLVAVGSDREGATTWTSPDGITWFRVPLDTAVFDDASSQQMLSVTTGGPGLVAVGSDWSGGDVDAAVWVARSED